jgi:integrase
VDLPRFLVDDLTSYCRHLKKESLKQGRAGQIDLLFTDPTTNHRWPYSQRKVQMLVKRVCRSAGLKIRNPHDQRHTYASLLLTAHQSPGYVQRQLGHSSISITMDIYCHWIPGEGRNGLEDALGGGTTDAAVPNPGESSHIFPYIKKGSQ